MRSLGAKRKSMIHYHRSITDQDLILSIDNIVLDLSVTKPERLDLLNQMISSMASNGKVLVQRWQGFGAGTFRNQTLLRLDEERSFWIGQGLIGNGTLWDRVRLDFNPNKVGTDSNFKIIREFLVRNSRCGFCRISRFDLAIDIPIAREKCFLVKDRRLYIERRHGEEYTQYLGSKSSKVGRVKLYNKSLEAKLKYPLSRLELTLSSETPFEKINIPTVFCVDEASLTCLNASLNDTQRFIVNAIMQGYGTLNDLGRKTRVKIEAAMRNNLRVISISQCFYDAILEQLLEYLK